MNRIITEKPFKMPGRISYGIRMQLILSFLIIMVSCKPVTRGEMAGREEPENKIILSAAQIQLANIKVNETNEADICLNLVLTGVLKVNEQSAVSISSRSAGRIEKLIFKNVGETVNKGDSLYRFYGEDLIAAEREYINLQNNNWNFSGKYEPSLALENKLQLLGMLPSQIARLKKEGKILFTLTIFSPVTGTIRSVNVTEGQYVGEGETLFELADDNQLWVEAQAYQDDLKYMKPGMAAVVTIPGAGNVSLNCSINNVNPSFERSKNVTLVRSLINNKGKNFYPGMLAIMRVQANKTRGLVIPSSAVISGRDGNRVWIRNEDGSFSARLVTTGIQSDDSILVSSGLKKMEMVVTSGAYLLNSELILKKGNVSKEETGI